MSTYSRNGFKWSINEILSLQREFELLGLSIDEIAQKHKRTPNAIMFKLDQEGFADYNVLYSNYENLNSQIPVEKSSEFLFNNDSEDSDSDNNCDDAVTNLSYKVFGLEESVTEIKDMIQKMMESFNKNLTSYTLTESTN